MRELIELNPTGFDDWNGLLALLNKAFSFMEGRIDPPSSVLQMTAQGLHHKAGVEDFFLIQHNDQPIACLFGQPKGDYYHIGKLAVDHCARGEGLARGLLDAAMREAARRGLSGVELQTRTELRENHRAFRAMGFRLAAASAHDGYDRATSLTFRRPL